jgi:hypothetical protein
MNMIRGRIQNGVVLLDESSNLPEGAEVRVELVESAQGRSAIELLDQWLDDRSGHDEAAWPELKTDLDRHRLSSRKLFNGEAGAA